MNHVERFRAVMNRQPADRLPLWEWAMWWDKTIERWKGEGLPAQLNSVFDIHDYFVFVAEGTFYNFAKFLWIAFYGPTEFSTSR